jgi:hypothetical protein
VLNRSVTTHRAGTTRRNAKPARHFTPDGVAKLLSKLSVRFRPVAGRFPPLGHFPVR